MSTTATATATTVSGEKPPRRFPPPCWTQTEALALIQSYRHRWYALRRGYLRTADWDAVADDVSRLCPGATPPKTSAQCRHKMEKLRQRYRAEKQRAASFPAGQFLSTWFYFDAMDSMERNGSEDTKTGNDLNMNTRGRGIRFKPFVNDGNLVTVASRACNNVRAHEEDNNINDDGIEDVCYAEMMIRSSLGKTHRSISQSVRPRKISKIGPNGLNNSGYNNYGYWNGNGEDDNDDDDDDDDDVDDENGVNPMIKAATFKKDDDSLGQIVSSIRVLADGFVKMEKMKMEMVHEIEKMRMEAEMKRNKMLLESQKQMVEAFVKGLTESKKQQ